MSSEKTARFFRQAQDRLFAPKNGAQDGKIEIDRTKEETQ
jgi:hypothetical protein